ncbi:type II toxin-antitoxin system VapC family toxin [Sulfurirhabdus autotrophica]|uniref:type II toxin-antitoxin system VapC family toxin n=1 Tax=Sulfurirhabdus autotrophica TaxID=1706046 RepID=UPI001CB96D5C|nr:type II toxin-antitoxin system VapC family toxin [Sulfurirhabdus autotrophica]
MLDTHVALWAITDNPNLSDKARKLILAARNTIWISSVSIWEISIKHSLGRRDMPVSGRDALDYFSQAGYRFLPIEPEHAVAIEELPGHHQDPFDRLLVAQALVEPMRLITHDDTVARYSDTIIHI